MNNLVNQIKWVVLAIVSALLVLFIVQNAAVIELRFFNWTITGRRAFLVITCVAIGFVLGRLFGATSKRH